MVAEMRLLCDRFGIEEFHFEDDSLFEDPAYVIALCRAIRRGLPGVLWQCPHGCHPADLRSELIDELAAAGCYRLYLGLHDIGPQTMQLLQRPWEPASLGPLAEQARRAGVELGGYFTLGLPGQTEADMLAAVRFAVRSPLAWAQFTPFRFLPGSSLYERRDELAPLVPPAPFLRRIIAGAYRQFYLTGGRWRNALRK